MIGAVLLAAATVTGGYVATYTFDRGAAVYARVATGAVLGMTLLAFAGFGLSLVLGLTSAVLVLAALVTLLPLVTLRSGERRAEIATDLRRVVAPSGALIISGVLRNAHDHVVEALAPMQIVQTISKEGWAALLARH